MYCDVVIKNITMKKIITTLFFIGAILNVTAQYSTIIPQPQKVVKVEKENYTISPKTEIIADVENLENATYLQAVITSVYNKNLTISTVGNNGIVLRIHKELSNTLGDEGYSFVVNHKAITITSATAKGVFYGIQSLRQLLPITIHKETDTIKVSGVQITDSPRFKWRAFMLDESRYFKGMTQVKKILDQMALLKMNIFHWHLTDDQGWRIEIKKYPKLTQIGAFRKDSQIGGWDSKKRSGTPHGGFYTQKEIKEIVSYALKRNITIVPEIEMPGHASAAIASYPWLGTIGTLKEVPVVFGKLEDSYNVSNPKVYQFIQDVLEEVVALFPSKIIHIGGDEVKFDAWKKSPEVQSFIKEKGLKSSADLQIYFTNKVSNFIDKKNARMMGWNEILGTNIHEWQKDKDFKTKEKLAKNAIIHFWKGNVNLISEAIKKGYDIVNSHHVYTYLDYSYKYTPLKKAYLFDPVPEKLDSKYASKVLGTGCQMWGEWIPTVKDMDKMIFPRIAAYAEVGWTSKNRKNYKIFRKNLENLLQRWKKEGISYNKKFEK